MSARSQIVSTTKPFMFRCRRRDISSSSVSSAYISTRSVCELQTLIRPCLNFTYSGCSSAASSSMAYQGQECTRQHLQAFISVLSHTRWLKTAGMLTHLQMHSLLQSSSVYLKSNQWISAAMIHMPWMPFHFYKNIQWGAKSQWTPVKMLLFLICIISYI